MEIRDITPHDRDAFLHLWADYLKFYQITLPAEVTQSTWSRLIDPTHRLSGRVAVVDQQVKGFALHHHHCSTWVPGDDVYLEDLFVSSDARGQGMGRALITDLMELARAKGWHRLYWNTDHGNTTARKLYDSIVKDDGHIRYRIKL